MSNAVPHEIDFAKLGPENLIRLGEDFVRASLVHNPMYIRDMVEKEYVNLISGVISRAGRSSTSLRDAVVLARTFRETMHFLLDGSPVWYPWFRLYAHAVLCGSQAFPNIEPCDESPDYEPLGFVDILRKNYHGNPVCIKVIRTQSTTYLEKIKKTLCHRVGGCKSLSHPNVLPVIQVSETLFPLCIMSPWMPDGNITNYTQRNPYSNRLMLLAEVCDGLSYLHRLGIFHGCIAPGNVLMTRGGRPCLSDFGIAGAFIDHPFHKFKLETVRYVAPEWIHRDADPPGKEGDVYSLAMTSFTVLTGVLPYDGIHNYDTVVSRIRSGKRPPRPMNPDATRWLQDRVWDMIVTCWSKEPYQRREVLVMRELFSTLGLEEVQNVKSDIETGRQRRGSFLSQVTSLFRFPRNSQQAIESLVNEMDGYLESHPMSDWERLKLFDKFRNICSKHRIVPKSMHIPDCSGESVEVQNGSYANLLQGTHEGRRVAIKVVRVCITSDLDIIFDRFCEEGVAWKHLRHPNVLPLLGVTIGERKLMMVSEWMGNGNINEFIEKNRGVNRTALLVGVANGLKYMHDLRIVHGGLKGVNILINKDQQACIADFGLTTITGVAAHAPTKASRTSSVSVGTLMSFTAGGTYRWMSPELLDPEWFGMLESEGNRPTRQSDCYALGMVIYEVLCGHQPFFEIQSDVLVMNAIVGGDRPKKPERAMHLGFSDELWRVVERCWLEDRGARPDVEEILRCLNGSSLSWSLRDLGQGIRLTIQT